MRVVSRYLTALDRQLTESVNILESEKVPEESMNLKNKWGGAKIPSLMVTSPKGLARQRKEGDKPDEDQEENH